MTSHTKGSNSFRASIKRSAGSVGKKTIVERNSGKSSTHSVSRRSERIIEETSIKRRKAMKVLANR